MSQPVLRVRKTECVSTDLPSCGLGMFNATQVIWKPSEEMNTKGDFGLINTQRHLAKLMQTPPASDISLTPQDVLHSH